MEEILLAYSLPIETVVAMMMLYKNAKVKVRSPDGNTDFLNIHTGVLQGDSLAPYLFIICLDYVFLTMIDLMKENGLTLEKVRSRRYSHELFQMWTTPMTFLTNTPTQAESLLHSLERAAGGTSLHVNADWIKYVCFNRNGYCSTLNVGFLKLVDKFTYLGSRVSSS